MTAGVERVARNASYSLVASFIAFVAGLVSSVVIARLLGPAELGIYALVLSMGGVMGMIVMLGIPHAITKYVAEYEARGERDTAAALLASLTRFTSAVAIGVGVVAFAAAPWLERSFDADGFAAGLRIAAIGLLPGALGGIAGAGLAGFQDYRRTMRISLAGTIFLFVTTVSLLAAGAGVLGAVAALAISGGFVGVLTWRGLSHHMRVPLLRGRPPDPARVKLRRYVPPVTAVLVLDAIVWQRSEVFFLGVYRSAREVAWYGLAFGISVTVMKLLPRAASAVLAPVASGFYGADDLPGTRQLFITGSRYITILAAPVVVGGSVLAYPLIATIYGEGYAPAATVLPIVLLAAGFGAIGSVTAAIQTGIERQDLVLKVAGVAALVNIALDFGLIPTLGILGAAIANAVAQVGAVVGGIVLTRRVIGAPFPVVGCLRVTAAAVITGGVAYPVTALLGSRVTGVLAGVIAGAAVYPAALIVCGGIITDDLERLRALREVLPRWLRSGYSRLLGILARHMPRPAEGGGAIS